MVNSAGVRSSDDAFNLVTEPIFIVLESLCLHNDLDPRAGVLDELKLCRLKTIGAVYRMSLYFKKAEELNVESSRCSDTDARESVLVTGTQDAIIVYADCDRKR